MWHTPVTKPLPEQTCKLCSTRTRLIAAQLGVCLDCIRNRHTLENFSRAAARTAELHTVRIGSRHLLSRDY